MRFQGAVCGIGMRGPRRSNMYQMCLEQSQFAGNWANSKRESTSKTNSDAKHLLRDWEASISEIHQTNRWEPLQSMLFAVQCYFRIKGVRQPRNLLHYHPYTPGLAAFWNHPFDCEFFKLGLILFDTQIADWELASSGSHNCVSAKPFHWRTGHSWTVKTKQLAQSLFSASPAVPNPGLLPMEESWKELWNESWKTSAVRRLRCFAPVS